MLQKINTKLVSSGYKVFLIILLILSLVGATSYYIFFIYSVYISSDGATYYVLAQEILNSGQYFPRNWFYANGDLLLFGKPGLIALINSLGIGGYSSYAATNFLLLLFSIFIIYCLLRKIGISLSGSLLASTLIVIPYSLNFITQVHGIGTYLIFFLHYSLLIFILLKLTHNSVHSHRFYIWLTVFSLYLLLASLENPSRFLVYYIAPLLIASILIGYTSKKQNTLKIMKEEGNQLFSVFSSNTVIISISVILSFSISIILHRYLEGELNIVKGAANATLIPLHDFPSHLAYTIYGILMLLGVDWQEGVKLSSFSGAIMLIKLILYPVAFLAPIFYTLRFWKNFSFPQQFFSLFSCSGFLLIGFIFSITTLQVNGSSEILATIRYMIPFLLFVLLCNGVVWAYYAFPVKLILSISLMLAILTAWNSITPVDANHSRREGVIKLLEGKDLRVGYAPYWYSHIFSLLSDGQLEVRPISVGKQIKPFYWLSSRRWYEPNYIHFPIFFLSPNNSADQMLKALRNSYSSKPDEQFSAFGYTVFVYTGSPKYALFDENYRINSVSNHQIGSFDTEKSALIASPQDGPGFLHYGPYIHMKCGKYTAKFTLANSGIKNTNSKKIGFVDISANSGKDILAKKEIYNSSPTSIDVDFTIHQNTQNKIEFRLFSYGISTIKLQAIKISQHSQSTNSCLSL